MPELHAHPDFDHVVGVGGRGGRRVDPERLGRSPEQSDASGRIGGGGEQESLGVFRERFETSEKVLLQLA